MENHKKRNIAKILVIVLASLAALFVAGLFFGGIWAENKIKSLMEGSSADGDRYMAEKISVNLFNRSVKFRNLSLRTSVPSTNGRAMEMDIVLDDATANGIGFPRRKGIRYLDIGSMAVNASSVTAVSRPKPAAETPAKSGSENNIQGIRIGRIHLTGATFRYETDGEKGPQVLEVTDLTLDAAGFRLDTTAASARRAFFCDRLTTRAEKIRYLFQKNAYLLHTGPVEIDSRTGTFTAEKIALDPQYPKSEFAAKTLSDWTQASAGTVSCHNIDFGKLFTDRQVLMDSVYIGDVYFISYKNRKVYQPEKRKKMIHESIQQLPVRIDISNIRLENIDATYEEMDEDGLTPGSITFNDITGNFSNVTNIRTGNPAHMVLAATARLMNAGRLEATFRLPVSPDDPNFTVEGNMGAMNLTSLNPTFEPLMDVRVEEGLADKLDFRITANTYRSNVHLTFLYHDLSVELLKEKGDRLVERKFLSFLVDKIVIKDNNPDRQGIRYGEGDHERDFTRSQFNYLWKSLMPGFKQTLIGHNRDDD